MKCTVCGTAMVQPIREYYCPREDEHRAPVTTSAAATQKSWPALEGLAEGWIARSAAGLPLDALPGAPPKWKGAMILIDRDDYTYMYTADRGGPVSAPVLCWYFSGRVRAPTTPSTPSPPPAATP